MSRIAQTLPKKELPERVHRELRKGETIYHSTLPCHVSAKFPEGKWVAQVRREEHGKLTKYPVKAFGTPKDALEYLKTLRPGVSGRVASARQGEPTVTDLYEFVKAHRQKRLSEKTKQSKETRWRLYIEPEWGGCAISQVSRRAAQEWITDTEQKICDGSADTLGLAQFDKVRTDLHALFECVGSFSPDYEDRKNPFAGLEFTPAPPRAMTTLESQHFAAIQYACRRFVEEGLCTEWIATMFLTSLLSGLREGETMALCRDQLDFENGAILVDRAMRRESRAIDPRTRLEVGSILPFAVNLPKGGTPTDSRARVVPMSDQLAAILLPTFKRHQNASAEWDFMWPSQTGKLKQMARFRTAWISLRDRLDEVATFAPIKHEGAWPEMPKRQGRLPNVVVKEARRNPKLRLPDIFGRIDFRDTRNSFASYMNELGLSQATREQLLGHGGGLTNTVYTVVTSRAFQDARERLSAGWTPIG